MNTVFFHVPGFSESTLGFFGFGILLENHDLT
jgi:hypothetical protein